MTTDEHLTKIWWKYHTVKNKVNMWFSADLREDMYNIQDNLTGISYYIENAQKLSTDRENYNDLWVDEILLDISENIDTLEKNMAIELLKRD
jgi:hypothetical protein